MSDSGLGCTPEQMSSYTKLAVPDMTRGASGGSESDTEQCQSPGVDEPNSEHTEPVDEDNSSGTIQSYAKVIKDGPAGGSSVAESDCMDPEVCPEIMTDDMDSSGQCSSGMSNGCGYCPADKIVPVLQEPDGLPAAIHIDTPESHLPTHVTSQPALAMPSERTDSSGQCSSAMSSGCGYCPADKIVPVLQEPDGPPAAIHIDTPESHLPTHVTSQPALATPSERTDSSGQSSSAMSSGFGNCPGKVNVFALTEPVGKAADIDTSRPKPEVSHPDLVSTLPAGRGDTSQENTAESVV